jgi:uncharacterized OsmC-like protein
MKKKKNFILKALVAILFITGMVAALIWFYMPKEQRNMISFMMSKGESYDNYKEYQVIERNDKALAPASFTPTVVDTISKNSYIVAITEMVKNEKSSMLKKGMVQTLGVDDYTGWQVLADEGADEGDYPFGPSPLSYYTAGIASNLHTQLLKAAKEKDVALKKIKVEVLNKFRWNKMSSSNGAGFLDVTTTNIIVDSDVSQDKVQGVINLALQTWTVGNALKNETVIEPHLVINGDSFDAYKATPGTSDSEISYDADFLLTSVTNIATLPEFLELEIPKNEGVFEMLNTMDNLKFEIFAISESVNNSKRPYLTKITISTPSEETWEIYADEFSDENDKPLAPTSLEYFTLGTALCLTSQTTLTSAMMNLQCTDYRVENQIDFNQETIDSTQMVNNIGTVHSYILVESNESQERLEYFYKKSLSLCFAGEGLKSATEMNSHFYLNGQPIH